MAKTRKFRNKRKAGNDSNKKKAATRIQRATRKKLSKDKKTKALEKISRATKKQFTDCAICMEKIPKKERAQTVCGHFFHRKCINEWCLQKVKEKKDCECPVCREYLFDMTNYAKKIFSKLKKEGKIESPKQTFHDWANERRIELNERLAQNDQEIIEREERIAQLAQRRIELNERIRLYRERRRQRRQMGEAVSDSSDSDSDSD